MNKPQYFVLEQTTADYVATWKRLALKSQPFAIADLKAHTTARPCPAVMSSPQLQAGHVLQSCPLHEEERVSTWATERSLGEKLHVTATDLCGSSSGRDFKYDKSTLSAEEEKELVGQPFFQLQFLVVGWYLCISK